MRSVEETLGSHGAQIGELNRRTLEMDGKLDKILENQSEERGKRKALGAVATVMGIVGGMVSGWFHR